MTTMAPKKTIPSPPAVYTPSTPIDPEQLKAEARAYALSGSTGSSSSGSSKRKSPPSTNGKATSKSSKPGPSTKPTSLSIHRPEGQMAKVITPKPAMKASTPTLQAPNNMFAEDDDDYVRFVKSLGLDDSFFATLENDDEDFHLSDIEDEDDDDFDTQLEGDDENEEATSANKSSNVMESTPPLSSPLSSSPIALPDFESDMYRDLEEELGSLLEEDMEAAVQSLMTSKKPTTPSTAKAATPSPKTSKTSGKKPPPKACANNNQESPATPLRDAARQGKRAQVTYQQSQQLRRLLTRHYQLLVQQAVLAVRAAHLQKINKEKSDFLSGETSDDLAEILDGAVGMIQDLDQNRKDAIRNSIQLAETSTGPSSAPGRRSLLSQFTESSTITQSKDRRLTRSAFSKTLQQGGNGSRRTAFDIPGLMKLKETFSTIDKSVDGGVKGASNILELPRHEEACKLVLRQAGAHVDDSYIPGSKDLSENFCEGKEFFGESFQPPCTEEQQMFLRRNRNLFTSGEDNLVLRGVNLYGEKQWILIADRYLPDRSVNIISQRYSKLCVMLYKAHGVNIDSKGNLKEPPKLESVDDIDNNKVKEVGLKKVEPPAILNVHRWSLEEDLSLLKAVPIMGHMWAELGARLIPHRDRGHLRKRYQVLERRVKATITRSAKGDTNIHKASRLQGGLRKTNNPVVSIKPTLVKLGSKTTSTRGLPKKAVTRKTAPPSSKVPPMSIETAAASLTFLRPHKSATPSTNASSMKASTKGTHYGSTATSLLSKHPGKVIPVIKLNPTTRKPAVSKRPPPKLPVAKSTMQMKPTGMEGHLNVDSSRAAFEKLVDGTSEEWSQMSRMKKMLENDDESQAADAIVSHLARSPVTSSLSKLPQLELDSNSMSGLSILHSEASRQATANVESIKSSSNSGTSIMARVLEGASKSSDHEIKFQAKRKEPPSATGNMESPRKRPAKNATVLSTPLPSTPKRPNFFSTSGTPIGLSPAFRASPGIRNSTGITLTPNPFSPNPNSVMQLVGDESMGASMFVDFQISEESRKELLLEGKQQPQHDPTPPPLTSPKNSMLGEQLLQNDLEAISALNSLSNSPARPKGQGEPKKQAKRSLFAAVVGGTRQKDPKKKLQF